MIIYFSLDNDQAMGLKAGE